MGEKEGKVAPRLDGQGWKRRIARRRLPNRHWKWFISWRLGRLVIIRFIVTTIATFAGKVIRIDVRHVVSPRVRIACTRRAYGDACWQLVSTRAPLPRLRFKHIAEQWVRRKRAFRARLRGPVCP